MLKLRGVFGITAATDRGNSGAAIGKGCGIIPGAEATHAEAGDIDTVGIDAIAGNAIIKQAIKNLHIPPFIRRALGRDNDKRKREACFDQFRGTVHFNFFDIISAFACSVQEEQQRPTCGRIII